MPEIVPAVEAQEPNENGSKAFEQLEARVLQLDLENQILIKRERNQRYWIKWIAILSGLFVIVVMLGALAHLTHNLFFGPFFFAGSPVGVAIVVAPIISITAITVAIFVGAFRKFEDVDLEKLSSGTSGVANIFNQN
jgi:hypothetical protein